MIKVRKGSPEVPLRHGGCKQALPGLKRGELGVLAQHMMEKRGAAAWDAKDKERLGDLDPAVASKEALVQEKPYPVKRLDEGKNRQEGQHDAGALEP